MRTATTLVIGAGPYALSTAAHARRSGIDCAVVGEPMSFWKRHMPKGMLLRSGADWHLDADGALTFLDFLDERGIDHAPHEPIPVDRFIDYAEWFRERSEIEVLGERVTTVERRTDAIFVATLANGERIAARSVVAAPGLGYFADVPAAHPVVALPADRWTHTSNLVDFAPLKGKRCLIVGGRQSAFESAALLAQAGAAEVHLAYRHDTPSFEPSDWSWVDELVAKTTGIRGWFRNLPAAERESIRRRFWEEGRLKLEPWLAPRIDRPEIHLHPRTNVTACSLTRTGEIEIQLDDGFSCRVDLAILATGYRVDVARVPYLAGVLADLRVEDGSPVLSEDFESSVPGLFLTGLVAARDFGPFFGFVRGCPAAARITVRRLAQLS